MIKIKYLTGIHALNFTCKLDACGDWHSKSINWNHPDIRESIDSVFKDYGIVEDRKVKFLDCSKKYNVANHIRSLLDMLLIGNYGYAQGMKEDYICNEQYTDEIFNQVLKLKNENNWHEINNFMKKEYKTKWIDYLSNLILLISLNEKVVFNLKTCNFSKMW